MMLKVPGIATHLPIKFILWLEGNGNYTWVHLTDRHPYLITRTLKWFEEGLVQFVRIHKSALVNPAHVLLFQRVSSQKAHVVLTTGLKLIIFRRRIDEVRTQLSRTTVY